MGNWWMLGHIKYQYIDFGFIERKAVQIIYFGFSLDGGMSDYTAKQNSLVLGPKIENDLYLVDMWG